MHKPHFAHEQFEPDELNLHAHKDEMFEQGFMPAREWAGTQSRSIPPCPKCLSTGVDARNLARKTGSAIGTVAGATSGIALALSGAETGATVGVLAGPAGAVCGAIAGAVIAGLIGGTAGCATGAVFGEVVDDKVLDNFRCHACGHTFSRPNAST